MEKKLYRSKNNRVIGGVCGGLAEYLAVDPLVMRLIFAALGLLGVAPIVILYVIMWVVVPEQPSAENHT